MIFHITSNQAWQQAQKQGEYTTVSLKNEGFIHCSTQEQVIKVANAFYLGHSDLIVLCIDEDKLINSVKWEEPAHQISDNPPVITSQEIFPHIYGAINLKAVTQIIPLIASENGFTWTRNI
ncbi:DUF952 domain-containing protein [Aphanothece hegewaldii CCALA 016]|uniref:DUF952 domain-containing protein n=1 Tax=Aphanothece hegewaldii CCALA 016 TaxID=2107694 RepID=A0A2T1M2V9_9CHRO|nr:DUF952 domain-containing protein [Aphanothece hegewaldii]PSF39007.1 DUF952 domain-containing protein [Aphanothece hegewaldii CCALA 016]